MTTKDYTFSTEEAAIYLKVSMSTLANWRYKNEGPRYFSPKGKVIYYQSDLDKWIKSEGVNEQDNTFTRS